MPDEILTEADEQLDPFNPFPETVALEVRDEFDLHSVRPREVKAVVKAYLTEARARGFKSVRLIHGKGIGVQREIVHSVLRETEFVETWTDAPESRGGWGATIVKLKQKVRSKK